MVFERFSTKEVDLFCFLHSKEAPTEAEWAKVIRVYQDYDASTRDGLKRFRCLAVSDGGGLNAEMRGDLKKFFAGRIAKSVIVSDSSVIRGMVTAASWFNPGMRAHGTKEMGQALHYLDVQNEQGLVMALLASMQDDIGGSATLRNIKAIRAA